MLTVLKFGGSSLADVGSIRRVAEIIAQKKRDGSAVAAVLSARGDTTDILTANARELCAEPHRRELDALLSTGELGSAALMAILLNSMGHDCVSLSGRQAGIITSSAHLEARITGVDTRRLERELGAGKIVTVAGFQGINQNDDITTLGRGGSDTTAVALAAALGADSCEIYSDVDGIYTADPRLVQGAKRLDAIDYDDMLLLALGGSQVLHSRAVEAAKMHSVELTALSSFKQGGGTRITRLEERPALCGITRDKARGSVSIVGAGVSRDTLAEAIAVLAHSEIYTAFAELHDGVCTLTLEADELHGALKILHKHFFEL